MSLERLLRPRSVAIVGATDKIGPGFNAWKALEHVGFEGAIHLINPNKPTLFDRKTFPSLADVPGTIDAVFIAIQYERVLDAVRQAADKGAGGVVILSSGFGEAGEEGAKAQRELAAIAANSGMAGCGPNCLGFVNFAGRAAMFGTSLPDSVPSGGVAAIVQSGSIGIALLNAGREIGLSHLITSGNEAVTTAADYLDVLIDDPSVRVLIVFLEQLRKPDKFIACARRARERGKPVIVLKTGRSQRGREAVMAHTGAVAGSDAACDAAFRAAGVIRVDSLDDLIETAILASASLRKPKARGAAMMSLSGGEIALALDNSESADLELVPPTEAKAELTSLLPSFAHIVNPLDLTMVGLYDPTIAQRCARALGAQSDVGALVMLQDAPHGLGAQQAARYSNLLAHVAEGAKEAGVPLIAVSNLAGEIHPTYVDVAKKAQVPCLRGTQEGLFAVARYLRWAAEPAVQSKVAILPGEKENARRVFDAVPATRLPTEKEARDVLAVYGVAGVREHLVTTPDEAVAAAESLGFPVVLKGVIENMVHKSEAGLVKVGLASKEEVRTAATDMLARAGKAGGGVLGLLVQEKVSSVAELLVGARVDPDFGPLIVVGGGGVTVELYQDVAVRLAPVDAAAARAMIAETRAGRLLAGWRGKPVADVAAAADTVAALSRFIADSRDTVAEAEINPLAVMAEGQGCRALDAVIVRRS